MAVFHIFVCYKTSHLSIRTYNNWYFFFCFCFCFHFSHSVVSFYFTYNFFFIYLLVSPLLKNILMIKILTKSNERLYKPAERMENNCYIPNLHGIGISEDNCGINMVLMLRKECEKTCGFKRH